MHRRGRRCKSWQRRRHRWWGAGRDRRPWRERKRMTSRWLERGTSGCDNQVRHRAVPGRRVKQPRGGQESWVHLSAILSLVLYLLVFCLFFLFLVFSSAMLPAAIGKNIVDPRILSEQVGHSDPPAPHMCVLVLVCRAFSSFS